MKFSTTHKYWVIKTVFTDSKELDYVITYDPDIFFVLLVPSEPSIQYTMLKSCVQRGLVLSIYFLDVLWC